MLVRAREWNQAKVVAWLEGLRAGTFKEGAAAGDEQTRALLDGMAGCACCLVWLYWLADRESIWAYWLHFRLKGIILKHSFGPCCAWAQCSHASIPQIAAHLSILQIEALRPGSLGPGT